MRSRIPIAASLRRNCGCDMAWSSSSGVRIAPAKYWDQHAQRCRSQGDRDQKRRVDGPAEQPAGALSLSMGQAEQKWRAERDQGDDPESAARGQSRRSLTTSNVTRNAYRRRWTARGESGRRRDTKG